jgi:hypothetical protein
MFCVMRVGKNSGFSGLLRGGGNRQNAKFAKKGEGVNISLRRFSQILVRTQIWEPSCPLDNANVRKPFFCLAYNLYRGRAFASFAFCVILAILGSATF